MAQSLGVESRICVVWKTKRPSANRFRYSQIFSLLDHEWNLSITCRYVFPSGVHYTVNLQQRIKRENSNQSLNFRTTTYVEDNSNYTGAVLGNATDVKNKDMEIWSFKEDDVFKALPSFKNHGKCRVVCVFHHVSPSGSLIKDETVHLSAHSDMELLLRPAEDSSNLLIEKTSSDKCVQAFVDIPPEFESTSLNFSSLLDKKIFIDLKLMYENDSTCQQRAVLVALSEIFTAMFQRRLGANGTCVDVADLEASAISSLNYVNSDEIVYSLYIAGHKYAMHSLTTACYDWMTRNLTEYNCLHVLAIADARNDVALKDVVISFITQHSGVLMSDSWPEFSDENPKLANEVYHKLFISTTNRLS